MPHLKTQRSLINQLIKKTKSFYWWLDKALGIGVAQALVKFLKTPTILTSFQGKVVHLKN